MVFFSFAVPVSIAQQTFYVDAAATSSGSGTLADPFQTIAYALSVPDPIDIDFFLVKTGDTLMVNAGVYPAPWTLGTDRLDGMGNPRDVKIIGYGSSPPIVGSATPGIPYLTGPGIVISGGQSSACELRNLVIQGWDQSGSPFGALTIGPRGTTTQGSSPTIENVRFYTNRLSSTFVNMGAALFVGAYCNPLILQCEFEDNIAGTSTANPNYGGAIGIGCKSRISVMRPRRPV